ncbi:uncharacterized protein J8A68_004956 [[Candida] subhashii]|uniref:Large ribosomal subunit protein mL46 n=1 Tax=[Candida] subhashii TaxID=561895 RepID=A0A8J5QE25_9ASCO|nr:uncharacterized protein J8A68_004956 [[Candida] subhashii]KAG7661497.1 hypothetical protein J8A68_004956 [[Candida] subhashii]
MRGVNSASKAIIRAYSTQQSQPLISSTLLLSRNPIVTQEISSFEKQFYKYQTEVWRRLMWTFPRWFYFKSGTLAFQKFRELNVGPIPNATNVQYPTGRPEIRQGRDRRFKEVLKVPKTYKEEGDVDFDPEKDGKMSMSDLSRKIVPNDRVTEADRSNDVKSLERQLSRTLYLVAKNGDEWKFPSFAEEPVEEGSSLLGLHEIAKNGLDKIGGTEINYFNVSRTPCHLLNNTKENKKEFFIKSHILSGSFVPQDSSLDFKWLTKEELKDTLPKEYYQEIEHLLSDI